MSCPGMAMLRTRAGLGRAEAALKHAHRRCPFLARNPGVVALPTQTIKAAPATHGDKDASAKMSASAPAMQPEALKLLASRCPVMAPVIHSPATKLAQWSVTDAVVKTAHDELMSSTAVRGHRTCPSLNQQPICPVTNTIQYPEAAKCPYAHNKMGVDGVLDSADAPSRYDYVEKFNELINRKKEDASYRIFNTVRRCVEKHPVASYYHRSPPDANSGGAGDHYVTGGTSVDGIPKGVEVWCSNDYLAVSMQPEVVQAVADVVLKEGVGSGGTRNISGNNYHHEKLEREIAALHGKEAALIFTSCFVANDATLSTLGSLLPGCIFYSDSSNHASMIQGIRNGRSEKRIFRHNDAAHLDELMSMDSPGAPKIVAFESVYSMCGSVAPIEQMVAVARKHNALTFLDEVHAVGLYGDTGAGVAERDGIMGEIDVISGTLAKAYGTLGGYIAGPRELVDTVRTYAAGFIFTTSLPPMIAAGAAKSIELLRGPVGVELRAEHQRKSKKLIEMLKKVGIPVLPTESHIVPVAVGDARVCKSLSDQLLRDHHMYVQSINFPTVPRGTERLRITPSPRHTDEMMNRFVNALVSVWADHGLEFLPVDADSASVTNTDEPQPVHVESTAVVA